MIYSLPSLILRSLLGVLLLVALGGCKIFHPYRLPTPKPSPEFKAQQEAAKARKKAALASDSKLKKKKKNKEDATDEAATDVSTPTGAPLEAVAAATPEAQAAKLPERSTVRYDKQGLMKKPKLMRRRRHNKQPKPFRPIESIRNLFKYGFHAKPNYSPDHRPAPRTPAPEPNAAPDLAPDPAPDGKP
ncbi:hypothetical protein [Hymenobacter terrenus]|uniref:hypothetical protein n=1 Tax=Hymenobacter terrenus TaxID=1629124 RepID=UPI000ACEFAB9|nr:hypothetical protein [Hymenobacter terrenus]